MKTAIIAAEDTFHFTNCAPQHVNLNRGEWSGLEDYILRNAINHQMKITVFTGPVFRQDDKTYRGYRIPADYWKIVVFNKNDSTVSATGYIRTQRNLIDNQLTGFSYGDYKTYQVPISNISEITGINFNYLTEPTLLTGKQTWDQKIHQITKLDQIKL